MEKEYKWIVIVETQKKEKTSVFLVKNKKYNIPLGTISWNNGYRKYAFNPLELTYYEEDCLRNIAEFLEGLKKEREKKGQL